MQLETLSQEFLDLVDKVAPQVVRVNGRRGPNASGLALNHAHVLTSERAVGPHHQVEIGLPDGTLAAAEVVTTAPAWDLALLKTEATLETLVTWSNDPRRGLVVMVGRDSAGRALGSPGLLTHVENGLVHRSAKAPEFLGGALVDLSGRVIGINVANPHPATLAYPQIQPVIADLIAGRSVEGSFLGIGLHPIEGGCVVVKIEPGGPAERAGVLIGDFIRQLDGQPLHHLDDLLALLRSRVPGSTVTIEGERGGRAWKREVVLEPRPRRPHRGPRGPLHRIHRFMRRIHHHGPPPPPPPPFEEGPPLC